MRKICHKGMTIFIKTHLWLFDNDPQKVEGVAKVVWVEQNTNLSRLRPVLWWCYLWKKGWHECIRARCTMEGTGLLKTWNYLGTVSKATLGNLLRDAVECLDTILNWIKLNFLQSQLYWYAQRWWNYLGTVSKATLGNLLRDAVECLDTILNWIKLNLLQSQLYWYAQRWFRSKVWSRDRGSVHYCSRKSISATVAKQLSCHVI